MEHDFYKLQILSLQEEREIVMRVIDSLPSDAYENKKDFFNARLDEYDKQIDELIAKQHDEINQDYICNQIVSAYRNDPDAMRTLQLYFLSCLVPPEPVTVADAVAAGKIGVPEFNTKEWFASIPEEEF